MRKFALILATAFMAGGAGCVAHVEGHHSGSSHPHGGPPGQAKKVVVVEASHFCVDSCDHFWLDGVWYIEVGHRHGPSCGHYLVKGKWGKNKGDDHPGEGKGPKDKDKKDKKDKDKD